MVSEQAHMSQVLAAKEVWDRWLPPSSGSWRYLQPGRRCQRAGSTARESRSGVRGATQGSSGFVIAPAFCGLCRAGLNPGRGPGWRVKAVFGDGGGQA